MAIVTVPGLLTAAAVALGGPAGVWQLGSGVFGSASHERWTEDEVAELSDMWIGSLGEPSADPSNRFADDPAAAELGRQLFFDKGLSADGRVSCASCHRPEKEFQDGTALAEGVGTTSRRTMPIAGTAHSTWLFWDGRADSQWSQALGPLESAVEHGGTRAQYAHYIASEYGEAYESVFGPLPDLSAVPAQAGPVEDEAARSAWESLDEAQREAVTTVFVNIGKAIAAYERRIEFGASRFDAYVESLVEQGVAPVGVLSDDEIAGLRLFIGKGSCIQCHNGPLLTDDHFHNTGIAAAAGLPADVGREDGARRVLEDPFNCRGAHSDADPDDCAALEFLVPAGAELTRAFKTPTLRNVADRPPYMHAGQISTLSEALAHYRAAPAAPAGTTELRPLDLTERELVQLEAFLRALSGGSRDYQRRP